MQLFIFLVLLAVSTSLDATIVQEAGGIEGEKLLKQLDLETLNKAGRTLESLGELLQGKKTSLSALTDPDVLDALKALSVLEHLNEDEEYFLTALITTIVVAAATGAVGAGVKYAVDRANKKHDRVI
ncbi:uncharacterized protein LOC144168411 [Haemaphysalis longicornis]